MLTSPRRLLSFALIALSLLLGCSAKRTLPPTTPKTPSSILSQAQSACEQGEYTRCLRLNQGLLKRGHLSPKDAVQAWQGVVHSALALGRNKLALHGLEQWGQTAPAAKKTWAWHKGLFRAQEQSQGLTAALDRLQTVCLDPKMPWRLRLLATKRLSQGLWKTGEYQRLVQIQAKLHQTIEKTSQRRELEKDLLELFRSTKSKKWSKSLDQIRPLGLGRYPSNLVHWEQDRRRLEDKQLNWDQAWDSLRAILAQSDLALEPQLQSELEGLSTKYGAPSQAIALLIPLTGAYADFGQDILTGASAAQWELAREGKQLKVWALNTAAEGWIQRLNELPQRVRFVGGPLRQVTWQALAQKTQDQRAYFTFLSDLSEEIEGQGAWRFMSSPDDQTRTLLNAASALGIQELAVLYPQEPFGRKLAKSFWDQAQAQNSTVTDLKDYRPEEPSSWNQAVADLLQVKGRKDDHHSPSGQGNQTTGPDMDFKALFIPDTLTKAQLLVPNLFYHDEDRLLILGPQLWAQALNQGAELEGRYFQLALTTGAWYPDSQGPGLSRLEQELEASGLGPPNFWVALGYDFVRLALCLDSSGTSTEPAKINKQLSQGTEIQWASAPIHWDEQGQARQDLFVLRPVSDGLGPASLDVLRQRLDQTYQAHARRVRAQAKQDRQAQKGPKEQE